MLPKAEERRSDLRNTTVMEVIIAVIIVLLFVIVNNKMEFASKDDVINKLMIDKRELQLENNLLN